MMRGDKGMTLMELLIVISILGLLVTLVLPFQGRMNDNVKKEETVQLLEVIRFGLLGAENAYDANGNRTLGGYVGDYGRLPQFVVHEWDDSTKEWNIPKDASSPDKPELLDTSVPYNFDDSVMPLGLWTNLIRLEGGDPEELMEEEWKGPYVAPPRDDFKRDDDIYTYTAPNSSGEHDENSRHFLLRQGEGRLTDGWGSSLLVYFDDKENLYFVSAGSDRRINFGTVGTSGSTDYGPIDPRLPNNDDNLVLLISKEQWNLEDQKRAMTQEMLRDMKIAIIGQRGSVTDGVSQPNGFVADMGSAELLTGSYVYDSGTTTVYKCIESHISPAGSFSASSEWEAVTGGSTGKTEADFPYVPEWEEGRQYHAAKPQLILINSDYVKVETPAGSGEYRYFRCVQDAHGQNPTASSSTYWVEDNTFAGQDWVLNYDPSTMYEENIIASWAYNGIVGFGVGWRGPYTTFNTRTLSDAWGTEIRFAPNDQGMAILSAGPDKDFATTADNITESIQRTEYEVPLTVIVKPTAAGVTPAVTTSVNDYMAVYSAFNGEIASIKAKLSSGAGSDGVFLFTNAGRASIKPEIFGGSDVMNGPATTSPPSMYDSTSGHGVWIPIGKAMVVYQSSTYSSASPKHFVSPTDYHETFILHPRTAPEITLGD